MMVSLSLPYSARNTEGDTSSSDRKRALTVTVGLSILIHAAVGWYVVSQMIQGMPLVAEPDPITVEIAAMPPLVKEKPLPQVETDKPLAPDKPRASIREVAIPVDLAPTDTAPLQPGPAAPDNAGPISLAPQAPPAPAAAPAPSVRASIVYPKRAEARGIEGSATVEITVEPGGKVSNVRIVDETPQGYRFGEAAADSVWRWEFATAQPGTYRVTVRFRQ